MNNPTTPPSNPAFPTCLYAYKQILPIGHNRSVGQQIIMLSDRPPSDYTVQGSEYLGLVPLQIVHPDYVNSTSAPASQSHEQNHYETTVSEDEIINAIADKLPLGTMSSRMKCAKIAYLIAQPAIEAPLRVKLQERVDMLYTCHQTVERLTADNAALREALQILYDETADYITINNLGDVHHNQSMKLARKALSPKAQEQP